ncbi:MAG: hypothetical protein B7X07_02450, partial [Actinobacteria bacterium 21-64-8]
MDRTLIIVKPDGVQRGLVGVILERFEARGLRLVAGEELHVHRVAGLQGERAEVEHHRRGELRYPRGELLHHGKLRTAVAHHLPELERHRLQRMVVAGEQLQFDLVGRLNERVARRREDFGAGRGIGHHLDDERRRHVGDRRRASARAPRPAAALARRHAAVEPAVGRREAHRVASLRERDARQRLRGVPVDAQFRATWHTQAGVAGQRFRGLVQVRRIHGPHRDIAQERPVDDAHHRGVARRASIARHERQVGVERS